MNKARREFAQVLDDGAAAAEKHRRDYVLAELRCARTRAQLAMQDIEAAGLALKSGMIGADEALEWLASASALKYLIPTEPESNSETISENEAGLAAENDVGKDMERIE